MGEIAEFLGETDDVIEFEENYEGIVANIDGESRFLDSTTSTDEFRCRSALERSGEYVLRCQRR